MRTGLDGNKKLTNPRRNFPLIVASIRHPWSTRWHEIHGSLSSPAGSIRIQLSSFRNNCYRFPTAMLHFQVFTSASPLSSPAAVRPPLSDPSILHTLLPLLSAISLSLSLALSLSLFPSVSLSPSYLTLSSHLPSIFLCPFSDATTFRSRSPVLVCLPSSTSTQTLSQASIYEYTMNVPLACLYRGPPPVQRISSFRAVSGSLSDTTAVSPTRVLFVSPSWTQTG